jgi:hypothetical protein
VDRRLTPNPAQFGKPPTPSLIGERNGAARYRAGARLKKRGQPASLLRTTFDGIGSYQTRDQSSGGSFVMLFVLCAAARRLQVAWAAPR